MGVSRFAMERPQHCIFAGAAGTHSVCICRIHQNMKLLLLTLELKGSDGKLWTYKDLLEKITCEDSSENCFFGEFFYILIVGKIKLKNSSKNSK